MRLVFLWFFLVFYGAVILVVVLDVQGVGCCIVWSVALCVVWWWLPSVVWSVRRCPGRRVFLDGGVLLAGGPWSVCFVWREVDLTVALGLL